MTNIVVTGAFKVATPTGMIADWKRDELAELCRWVDLYMQDKVGYGTATLYAADLSRTTTKMRDASLMGVSIQSHSQLYELLTFHFSRRAGETLTPHQAMANMRRYGNPFAFTSGSRSAPANRPSARSIPMVPASIALGPRPTPEAMSAFDRLSKSKQKALDEANRKAPVKETFGQLGIRRKVNLD